MVYSVWYGMVKCMIYGLVLVWCGAGVWYGVSHALVYCAVWSGYFFRLVCLRREGLPWVRHLKGMVCGMVWYGIRDG